MSPDDLHALRLLAGLQEANETDTKAIPGQTSAVRVTLHTPDGKYVGEALLSARAAHEAANAVSVAAEYALAKLALHPLLIADIEDHFDAVDPQSYLDDVFGSQDADASLAAYEELVTGEWDGGL